MHPPKKIFSYFNVFTKGEYVLPVGEIRQVEELALSANEIIDCHTQQCEEITFVISGKATVFCDNEALSISSGQVHFINRKHVHKIIAGPKENLRYICVGLIPDYNYKPTSHSLELFSKHKQLLVNDNGDIRLLCELLLNEFYVKDTHSDLMINSYLTQIIAVLHRIYENNSSENKQKKRSTENNYVIYNVLRYIDREYLNIDSVKSMAHTLSYNEYYLAHLFKQKMGVSIKQYLLAKKIKYAERLLTTTDLSIETISLQLNFNSAHSFYQAFKKRHNISPGDYRKKFSENINTPDTKSN